MHPDDGQPIDRLVQWVLRRREVYQKEYRIRRGDGSYTWWEERGAPTEFRDGRPVRWVGVIRNITERKQAEEQLRRALQQVQELKAELEAENVVLRAEIASTGATAEVIGKSAALKRVLQEVEQVAGTNAPVLITGETGTGKELVARAIHRASPRRERLLVMVNCAALAPTLRRERALRPREGRVHRRRRAAYRALRAGHTAARSSSTRSASWRRMSGEAAARPAGAASSSGSAASETVRVDVRVIAATNRDLEHEVKRGRFRQDLYYRLGRVPDSRATAPRAPRGHPLARGVPGREKGAALGQAGGPHPAPDDGGPDRLRLARERARAGERDRARAHPVSGTCARGRQRARRGGRGSRRDRPDRSARGRGDATATTLAKTERAHILLVCEACGWRIRTRGRGRAPGPQPQHALLPDEEARHQASVTSSVKPSPPAPSSALHEANPCARRSSAACGCHDRGRSGGHELAARASLSRLRSMDAVGLSLIG